MIQYAISKIILNISISLRDLKSYKILIGLFNVYNIYDMFKL